MESYCTTFSTEASVQELTQKQCAGGQGPADLHVMDVHVLAGYVLHRNLLCNLVAERHKQDVGFIFID